MKTAGLFNASELGHLGNGEHQEMVVLLSRCCFVVKEGGRHDVTVYLPRYQLQLCESNCIDGNERPFLFWGHALLKCPCK